MLRNGRTAGWGMYISSPWATEVSVLFTRIFWVNITTVTELRLIPVSMAAVVCEDIEILFSGQKYFTQVVRGREACDMPSRRWNKPSIMLQCEDNYSNAHGTPWVYKHQKIGKLVGMPVREQ